MAIRPVLLRFDDSMQRLGEKRALFSRVCSQILGMHGAIVAAVLIAATMLPLGLTRGAGQETAPTFGLVHVFTGGAEGSFPSGGLTRDMAENFYGTAEYGGDFAGACATLGCGVVYKLDAPANPTVLYTFTGGADGAVPMGSLVRDAAGNLYGTTYKGGTGSCFSDQAGVVFKLDTFGKETVLHTFTGPPDGCGPQAGLGIDRAGNLYGTTSYGGVTTTSCSLGCGVVFKLESAGNHYTVLHRFTGADGATPAADLIHDTAGNLYGTTVYGGNASGTCRFASLGCGVVFKIDPRGYETVLYAFSGGADGSQPFSSLIRDDAGNLYGTTFGGGNTGSSCAAGGYGCGVVFKLDPLGNETVLYTFTGGADGSGPITSLVRDAAGNLYGTTDSGGAYAGFGTVFELNTAGQETVLHSFDGHDGDGPSAGMVLYKGSLFGPGLEGGPDNYGVLFRINLQQ